MANFMASGLFALGDKLGAVIWQFPPGMKFDAALFEAFLKLLPRNASSPALPGASRSLAKACRLRMRS